MRPSSTLPTTWSSAWNIRLGAPVALDEAGGALDVAGQVDAGVAGAVDEGVTGVAVRRDGADPHGAVLVGDVLGLLDDRGAHGAGVLDAPVDVGHLQGDVDDAVTVLPVVVEQGALRRDPALDDEAAGAAPEHERLVVAVAGLRAAVADQLHPVGGLVVVRGLGGVADDEHQRVPPGHREGVLALVVRHQADELLELVEVEVGVALFGGQGDRVGHGCTVDHAPPLGNHHR